MDTPTPKPQFQRVGAQSPQAQQALQVITRLQAYLVEKMETLKQQGDSSQRFLAEEWYRNQGKWGGGIRYIAPKPGLFNRASVNLSQVQYERVPEKPLASATALSTILHPVNPHAPSLHMHLSWTEMKKGEGYWRIMADLNPSLPYQEDTELFENALREQAPEHFPQAREQGDRYFWIPALQRHRGVSHFYLEQFNPPSGQDGATFAQNIGTSVTDTYQTILQRRIPTKPVSREQNRRQLEYHTLYFFQVLTLDRGTTAGLLVHDENDIGTLGSLPSRVDRSLLQQWLARVPLPQDQLLRSLVRVLSDQEVCLVSDSVKKKLAERIRSHYRRHPEAQKLQAAGKVIPTTIDNHRPLSG